MFLDPGAVPPVILFLLLFIFRFGRLIRKGLSFLADCPILTFKSTPMSFFKKLRSINNFRPAPLLARPIRVEISRKDWIDFGLVVVVSFLIVVYKVNKA